MKTVILAGGYGTRLSEETARRPKPMVEIGGKPILAHIMEMYARHGMEEFIICLGYKGEMIMAYLENNMPIGCAAELVDTGQDTGTGGRLKRVAHLLTETFCMTYGDGLSNIDLRTQVAYHHVRGAKATVAAVIPPARYGALNIGRDNKVRSFSEKPPAGDGWVSGGFFVLEPSVLDHISGDESYWEIDGLPKLAAAGELMAYRHTGFWAAMDTLRDRNHLEALWAAGNAPWSSKENDK